MASSLAPNLVGKSLAFHVDDGVAWLVREYAGNSAMANSGGPCLIFESDGVMRRVRGFPANWREIGADALMELSWRR